MQYRTERETVMPTKQAMILSSMMIILGLVCIYDQFNNLRPGQSVDWWVLASKILLIICGLIPLLYRDRTNYFAIGMYAIGLGAGRVIRSIPDLFSKYDVVFLFGLIMIVLGGNLAYKGFDFILLKTKNPNGMMWTAILMSIVYLFMIVVAIYTGQQIMGIFMPYTEMACYILLYMAFLCALLSKSVYNNTPMGSMEYSLNDLAMNAYTGYRVELSDENIALIKEGLRDDCTWASNTVAGTEMSEKTIELTTDNGTKDMIIQKWNNEKELSFTVVIDSHDSFIAAERFSVSDLKENDDSIELYGKDGLCAIFYRRAADDTDKS